MDIRNNHTPPARTPPPNENGQEVTPVSEATRVAFRWGNSKAIKEAAQAFEILMPKTHTQGCNAALFAMLVEIRDLGIMQGAGDTSNLKALIADFEQLAKIDGA